MKRTWRSGLLAMAAALMAIIGGCAPREKGTVSSVISPAPESGGAVTQPAAKLPEKAGLQEYLSYAALHNPGLEAAFDKWRAAVERIPQARSLPDPKLNYRYFIEKIETRVGPQRQSLGISQTFPWYGKRELRGSVAAEAANAAHQRYKFRKLKLFYRVKTAYYEYYYLARAVAVTSENIGLVKHLEEVALIRFQGGANNHHDVIRAQIEIGTLEDRLEALEEFRRPIIARLNAALNRPPAAVLPWPKSIDDAWTDASDEQILESLRHASPEIEELRHEITRQRHAITLAKKQYYPDITVGLAYIDTGTARMRGVSGNGDDPIAASVSINIPLWVRKNRAGVREAEAKHRAALRAKLDRENTLGSDVKLSLYHYRDAGRKIMLYRGTLLPKALESLKATETAYQAGRATFLDLIDGQRVLLEFQLALERASTDHAVRLGELEMLTGRDIPRRAPKKKD